MAESTSDGQLAGEKPAGKSLTKEIRFYLQEVKGIENSTALNLFEKTEQTLRTLMTHMNMKNENDDRIMQTLNKIIETMKKIQKTMTSFLSI